MRAKLEIWVGVRYTQYPAYVCSSPGTKDLASSLYCMPEATHIALNDDRFDGLTVFRP